MATDLAALRQWLKKRVTAPSSLILSTPFPTSTASLSPYSSKT
jgi:hypothetical protein